MALEAAGAHTDDEIVHDRDVALGSGTERPFTGKTVNGYSHDYKGKGTWVSAVGGLPLFSSDTKFDSGTGDESDPHHTTSFAAAYCSERLIVPTCPVST